MVKEMAYLLKKRWDKPSLYTKLDSSHSFGMTNNAVISTEGRNLMRSVEMTMAQSERKPSNELYWMQMDTNERKPRHQKEIIRGR